MIRVLSSYHYSCLHVFAGSLREYRIFGETFWLFHAAESSNWWDMVGDGILPPGVMGVVEGMTLSTVKGEQGVVMASDP